MPNASVRLGLARHRRLRPPGPYQASSSRRAKRRLYAQSRSERYSSLSTLRTFPGDRIKIDRSSVHDLLSKIDSRAIIQAVAQLASSLG